MPVANQDRNLAVFFDTREHGAGIQTLQARMASDKP